MNSFLRDFWQKKSCFLSIKTLEELLCFEKTISRLFFLMKFDTICMLCVCMIANRSLGKGNSLLIHLNTLLGVKIALYIIFLREKF